MPKERLAALAAALLLAAAPIAARANIAPAAGEVAVIRHQLAVDVPFDIELTTERIASDPALHSAALDAGIVDERGGRLRFTAAGRAAGRACPSFDEPGLRCFMYARGTFAAVVRHRHIPATLDSGGTNVTTFAFRAVPLTRFGRALAAHRALVCEDARTHAIVPWTGATMLGTGQLSWSWLEREAPAQGVTVVNCPRAPWSVTVNLWTSPA